VPQTAPVNYSARSFQRPGASRAYADGRWTASDLLSGYAVQSKEEVARSPWRLTVMNTFSETDLNSLDPNDRAQVIRMARQLLKANNPGVLSTVDEGGSPQSRWMATMSFEDFPNLYTLTAANSRKVAQIREHPVVQWMFTDRDYSFVVNLMGRAELFLRDAATMKRVWHQIADKSRAYFMNARVDDGPGFVVIHTQVETVECTIPKRVLRFVIDPRELAAALGE
jgi:general stress protein 26